MLQIAAERRERAEIAARTEAERAHRDARRAAKPGAGDQSQLVPGVYKLDGEIYVVKGNRDLHLLAEVLPRARRVPPPG